MKPNAPMRYPAEDIDAIRQRSSIVQIIEELTPLRSAGGGKLKCLCLFHDERTPSMTVNPTENFYHCFGCNAGGDVITLVRELNGFSFTEAVESLSAQFGIHIQARAEAGDDIVSRPTRIYDANRHAAAFFRDALLTGPDPLGRQFLQDRQFDPATAAEGYGMGYAPNTKRALTDHLLRLKFTSEEIVAAGLASEHNGRLYDVFQGRPLWAIKDGSGRVLGFGARRVRDDDRREGKYINTSETAVYKKSRIFYGLDKARRPMAKLKQAIIVEGYTDVMSMQMAGLENTVATCGTALTEEHLTVLRRIVGEDGEIIFCFDGDAAGIKAAMNSYSIGKNALRRMSVLTIPGGHDPDSLRVQAGLDALAGLLPLRRPLIESVIRGTIAGVPLATPEDKLVALDRVAAIVGDVADPLLRAQYAPLVAELLHLPQRDISTKLKVSTAAPAPKKEAAAGHVKVARSFEKDALQLVAQRPQIEVAAALLNPALYVSPIATVLVPILDWWRSGQDLSVHALMNATPAEYDAAVREITMGTFDVPDDETYGQELLTRLQLAGMDRQIEALITRTKANPDDSEGFRHLRALRTARAEHCSR